MIKEIIPAITPDNITDIDLLKAGLDIFLEYLTEHSDISIDIKNILDENKVPIYEEFVKIYLNNIYTVLTKSEHNDALYSKLKTMYSAFDIDFADIDLSVDPVEILKTDYILTNKDFKASKGTPKAMEYIYNIIIKSGIQNDFLEDNIGGFVYYEGDNLFEYKIEGTMIDEMYEHFVKPLTHPVGWAYFYQRVFYMSFIDRFDLKLAYHFDGYYVMCPVDETIDDTEIIVDDYIANIDSTGNKLLEDTHVLSNVLTTNVIPNIDPALVDKIDTRVVQYFKYGKQTVDGKTTVIKIPTGKLVHVLKTTLDGEEVISSVSEITLYSVNNEVLKKYDSKCIMKNVGIEVRRRNGTIIMIDDYLNNISNEGSKIVDDNTVVFISTKNIGSETNPIEETIVFFRGEPDIRNGEQYYIGNEPQYKDGNQLRLITEPLSIQLLSNDGKILIDYDVGDINRGLFLHYSVEAHTIVADEIAFEDSSHLASTTGKLNVIGAGNVYIGAFVIGAELVNKDVSVTYKSYTGVHDGAAYVNSFAVGGIESNDKFKYGTYWDEEHQNFDEFDFDEYNFGGNRPTPNLSGKTARDEFEMSQELQYCAIYAADPVLPDGRDHHLCEPSFEDKFIEPKYWDQHMLKFGEFNFDSEYVSEEFIIHYNINVWDTDLYFDYFQFDGEYIGGGFH